MEIWLQVDQIDRRDALYRAAAADELEQGQPAGIRLLFQCEPRCGPSPLEPGPRTPHRRIRQAADADVQRLWIRSEEHTSELQSLMRISYAVFCLKKKTKKLITHSHTR